MGNYRFKLSDMIPNAWFYKLKDMGKSSSRNPNNAKKKQPPPPPQLSKPKQPHNNSTYPRKSYYYTRELIPTDTTFYNSPTNTKFPGTHLPDPPRKSSKQRLKRRPRKSSPRLVTSSVSAGCNCRATVKTNKLADSAVDDDYSVSSPSGSSTEPEFGGSFPPEFRSDCVLTTDDQSFDNMVSCHCRAVDSNVSDDIVIDIDEKSINTAKLGYDSLAEPEPELELPPIITKPGKFFNDMEKDVTKKKKERIKEPRKYKKSTTMKFQDKDSLSVKVVKEESNIKSPIRRSLSVSSPGVRLRVNSPRIVSRRYQPHHVRKSLSSSLGSSSRRSLSAVSDSFAVVKSSFDPQRDFRESMVEMILQNNIRASKDLEELLACYLSMNSDQYHDLIIKVFKQIWFDLTDIRLK